MIAKKTIYIHEYVIGDDGIFDTVSNIIKKIIENTIGDLASKLLVSTGKIMASEAGKRSASRFTSQTSVGYAP